jgi:predicted secreted protein
MELQVVSHCLLNPYTRVKGLEPIMANLQSPLIQLPCPEALYLGLDRWAVTRNQLNVPEFRRFCRSLIQHYADLIEMLANKGASIKVVGIAGSPSCGVFTVSTGYQGGKVGEASYQHIPGRGVFIEELIRELEKRSVAAKCQEADKTGAIK